MPRLPHVRPPTAVLGLVLLLLVAVAPAHAAARVETDAEGLMLSLINDRRASHELPPLVMANDLRDDARDHALRQLSTGSVHHDPDGASDICCFRSWGENVAGWSGNEPLDPAHVRRVTRHLNNWLFDSARHRQNLVSSTYGEIGIGIVADRNASHVYVTQVFREPADPSSYHGRFADDDTSSHQSSIEAIANAGITGGCAPSMDNRYCPDLAVSRAQVAAMLNRALGLPPAQRDHFTDDAGSPFEPDINAIAEAGITTSCDASGTRFCPSASVNRGEVAAFLRRALDLPDIAPDDFTDDTGSLFEPDINAIAEAGVTEGCNPPDDDRYCPDRTVPRGEMATFLARAFDL